MRKNEIRKITEGAMIVAIIGVIMLLNRQTGGIMEVSFYWCLSMPMILYSATAEMKYSVMVGISALFVSFILSTPQSIFYLFCALFQGIVYGWGIQKKWSNSKLLGWTMVSTFVSEFTTMYLFAGLFGYDLLETRKEVIAMIESLPFDFMMSAELIFETLDILTFIMIVVFQSLCVHLLAHLIFIKMKKEIQPIRINLHGTLPLPVGIGGIVSYLCVLALPMIESLATQRILLILCSCFFIANFVYGMIVLRYMNKISKMIRFILILVPLFWPVVMILGIADTLSKGKIKKGVV